MLWGGLGKVKGDRVDVPNMREDIFSFITPPNLALPGPPNALRSALFLEISSRISSALPPVFDHALRIQVSKNVYDAKTAGFDAYIFRTPRYTPENDELINNHHFHPQDDRFSACHALSTSYNTPHFGFIVLPY